MAMHPHKHTFYCPEWEELEALAKKESDRTGYDISAGQLARKAIQVLLKNPEKTLKLAQKGRSGKEQ